MFPLCLLAKIEVYMINHNKNNYFIGVGKDKRIMFPICLLAKIELYMINDNKNIYFLAVFTNMKYNVSSLSFG